MRECARTLPLPASSDGAAGRFDGVIAVGPARRPLRDFERRRGGLVPPLGNLLFDEHGEVLSSGAYNMAEHCDARERTIESALQPRLSIQLGFARS